MKPIAELTCTLGLIALLLLAILATSACTHRAKVPNEPLCITLEEMQCLPTETEPQDGLRIERLY